MSRRPGMSKAEFDPSAAAQLIDQIKTVTEHLAEIPETDRQRLSHASRMHFDLAEQTLKEVLQVTPVNG
jgi:uncharacterized membrane protein